MKMIVLATLSLVLLSTAVRAEPVRLITNTQVCPTIHDLLQFEAYARAGNVRGAMSVKSCHRIAKGTTVQVLDKGDEEDSAHPARVSQGYVGALEVRASMEK
jgi:hypothetical protein